MSLESQRRGRPRKPQSEAQSTVQPEAVQSAPVPTPGETARPTTETSQVLQPSVETPIKATEPDIETYADRITRRFVLGVFKEGLKPLDALNIAQDGIFGEVDMLEGLRVLNSLTKIALTAAEGDPDASSFLINRQKSYESALRRLDPRFAQQTSGKAPSSPSNLPPMTGKKG